MRIGVWSSYSRGLITKKANKIAGRVFRVYICTAITAKSTSSVCFRFSRGWRGNAALCFCKNSYSISIGLDIYDYEKPPPSVRTAGVFRLLVKYLDVVFAEYQFQHLVFFLFL